VTSVPKESCELNPIHICVNEVISLPSLELVNECVDVPKEVCAVQQVNPREVLRPVIKKFCKNPKPEANKEIDIVTVSPGKYINSHTQMDF
jgi:hypothetical protein